MVKSYNECLSFRPCPTTQPENNSMITKIKQWSLGCRLQVKSERINQTDDATLQYQFGQIQVNRAE